jgi:hypothetical protein
MITRLARIVAHVWPKVEIEGDDVIEPIRLICLGHHELAWAISTGCS